MSTRNRLLKRQRYYLRRYYRARTIAHAWWDEIKDTELGKKLVSVTCVVPSTSKDSGEPMTFQHEKQAHSTQV